MKTWSTILPKFYGLSIREIMTLIMKVDDLSRDKVDYMIPCKKKNKLNNEVDLNTVDELPDANLFDTVSFPMTELDMQYT